MPCGVQSFSERDKKVFNTKTNIVQWCRRSVKERKNNSKDPQWEMWLSCKQTTNQSLLRKSHHWTHWMNEGILITSWLHKRAENGLLAKILCTRSHLPAMKRHWCESWFTEGKERCQPTAQVFTRTALRGLIFLCAKNARSFCHGLRLFFFFLLMDNSDTEKSVTEEKIVLTSSWPQPCLGVGYILPCTLPGMKTLFIK